MIVRHLESSINDIENLIKLTRTDIKNIKLAKHDELRKSASLKEELIVSFESKKSLLNYELTKLTKANSDKSLDELLSEKESELLEVFKKNLSKLKNTNRDYAKFVSTISEFYNSLVGKLFAYETSDYSSAQPVPASFLKVSA